MYKFSFQKFSYKINRNIGFSLMLSKKDNYYYVNIKFHNINENILVGFVTKTIMNAASILDRFIYDDFFRYNFSIDAGNRFWINFCKILYLECKDIQEDFSLFDKIDLSYYVNKEGNPCFPPWNDK